MTTEQAPLNDGMSAVPGDVVLNTYSGRYHRVVSIDPERDVDTGSPILIVHPEDGRAPYGLRADVCRIVDLPNDADLADPESLELWLSS